MEIKGLLTIASKNATEKGFHNYNIDYEMLDKIKCLLLIHSEISEAVEALREGNQEMFYEELADVFIRLADLCGTYNIDIEYEIKRKMEINKNRPHLHNKRF